MAFQLKIKQIFSILTLTVFAASCSKITPAGFWTSFRSELIVTKNSDQGPWGGRREIHWKSENEETFDAQGIIDFATKNGWQLTDSLAFRNDSLTSLTNYPNTDYSYDILNDAVLEQITSNNNRILVFETGWIAVEPGNARDTEKNGFATINSNGTELRVYHLWGE